MARPVSFVLMVTVLSLVYRDALVSVSESDCSSSHVLLKETDVQAIYTHNFNFNFHIGVFAFVKPSKLFHGVAAELDGYGTRHLAWFPLTFPEDQCLPQRGEWGKIEIWVTIRNETVPGILDFKLWYGGCSKACYGRTIIEHKDNWNLTLVSYGKSEWRLKKPNDSCLNTISGEPHLVFSLCQPPPQEAPPHTNTTTFPQPATKTTTLMVTYVSTLTVAMVGIVLAVVAMVVGLTWVRKWMTSGGEDQTPHM